jgi:hypothetical protein
MGILTMKNTLLASVAALALLAMPARAQLIVNDPAHMAETIARGVAEVQQLKMQYEQLVRTYEAVTGARSVGDVASAVGGLSRMYLPDAGVVADMMNGRVAPGAVGRGGEFLTRNRIYNPGGDDWSEEMQRRENATAAAQAIAARGVEDAQERIAAMDGVQRALEGDFDIRQLGAYLGAIAMERQNLAAHDTQLRQVQTMLMAENRVDQQRAEQRWRMAVDDYERKTAAALAGW